MDAQKSALSALEGLGQQLDSQRRSPPEQLRDPHGALLKLIPLRTDDPHQFIEHLLSPDHQDTDPQFMAIGYELEALLSIYSPDSVKLSFPSRPSSLVVPPLSAQPPASSMEKGRDSQQWNDAVWDAELGFTPGERIRYEITLPVWEEGEELEGVAKEAVPDQPPTMRVLVSLPPTYPNSSPPQLQLLGRYLGSFSIDSGLFGDITRTYISSTGVPFTPGDVCVFEGLTHVQSVVREWYISHLKVVAEGEAERSQAHAQSQSQSHLIRGMSTLDITHTGEGEKDIGQLDHRLGNDLLNKRPDTLRSTFSYSSTATPDKSPTSQLDVSHLKIVSSEPIVDRKSTFVGHAVKVTDEREVPLVIHELLSDRKIAKAAHPAIFAYRIAKDVGGAAGKVYNTDYDDDGETAAGARLKHLIEILELENVLVVVTRWFGGIHLGPDRFKHINQAARDALESGGFLDEKKDEGGHGAGGRRRGKK
ncbi:impact family protein [Kwoniella heveanensis BCC8398]|uniref:Impact family protein n=1 Tax=Kwoniella heveanensis BCC8398 TaxID=1296120 RepID=A0A1B9H2R3_9TREE|nr:impact family protein [Kwoniella heveanensis BCC8398]